VIEVEGTDGQRFQFPDDTPPDVMREALRKHYARSAPKPAASVDDTDIMRDIGGPLVTGVGQLAAPLGQVYGMVTGDFDTAAMRGAQKIIEKGEETKSPGLRERERLAQERIAAKEGFFPEALQAVKEYASDPRLLMSGILASAPSMLGGLGIGAVAGKAVRTVAARKMAEEAAKKAGQKAAVRTAIGTAAVQQGGSVGEEAYNRVIELPPETLAKSPQYQALIAEGVSPEEARQQLALSVSRKAFAAASAISAGTAGLAGVEKSLFGDVIERGVIRRVLSTGAKEAAQEGAEEGGGQLAQNIAVQAADPEADTMQGVGGATAQGAMIGFGMGAPLGAMAGGPSAPAPGEVPPPAGEVPPPAGEVPPAPPSPEESPLPEGIDPEDLQRRAAEYTNVGYAEVYAQEMALVDILKGIQTQRDAERQATSAAAPEAGEAVETPIEEPRRALRPVDRETLKAARQQLTADVAVFPEDLIRQPTPEELEIATQEFAQDPANLPLDVLNAVMERNDQRAPAGEAVAEPVAEGIETSPSGPVAEAEPVDAPPELKSVEDRVTDLEEQVQEEDQLPEEADIDYENHPLMVDYNSRFDGYLSEVEDAEHVASVRARARKLIKAGVLDESVMDDINETMADEEPGFRADAGRDALVEAIENARDEGVTDIEDEINQLFTEEQEARQAAPAPAVEPEPAAAEEELTYGVVEAALDDALEEGEVDQKFAAPFRKALDTARGTPPGEQPRFTPQQLMDKLVEAGKKSATTPASEIAAEAPAAEAPAAEAPAAEAPPSSPPPPPTPPREDGSEPAPKKPRKPKAAAGEPKKSRKRKTAEEVAEANKKIEEAMAGYRGELATDLSMKGSGIAEALSKSYDAHSIKDIGGLVRNAFNQFFNGLEYGMLRMQLFRLPTRELVINAERLSAVPATGDKAPIRKAYDIEDRARALRATLLNAGARIHEETDNFITGGGKLKHAEVKKRQLAFFRMLDLSRQLAFNPTTHKDLDTALAEDSVIRAIQDNLANAKRNQERGKAKVQLRDRADMIKRVWSAWEKLGAFPGGYEAYKTLVDYYSTLTRATRNEMGGFVRGLKDILGQESVDQVLKVISNAQARLDAPTKEKLEGDIFDNIPASAFPMVYVPWNRFGKYVLRIPPGTKGYPYGFRRHYSTLAEREQYIREVAAEIGEDPNNGNIFERHSNPNRAKRENTSEAAVIRDVLSIIRNADLNIDASNIQDDDKRNAAVTAFRADLETELTELLLAALPEESISKQFIPAKGVAGRSVDHLQVLAYNVQRYANQLPRLKFGYQLRRALDEADEELKGMPQGTDREQAEILLDEIGNRLEMGLNSPNNNPLISAFNSFGHTMLLSAPASALNNAVVTWQRAAFELSTDYGPKAAKTLLQLEGIMRLMGTVQDDPTGNVRRYYAPTLLKLPIIRDNPVYRRAFLEMRDVYGAFGYGFVNEIVMQGRKSSIRPRTVPGYVMDGVQKIAGIINAPFGAIERITNEKIGMAAFMLEYERQKGAGKTDTEAFNAAVDRGRTAITDIVGKYGQAERPPLFRGAGSLLFLFKTFALNLGAFIERQLKILTYEPLAAATDIMRLRKPKQRNVYTKEEKKQAIKLLAALYAGNAMWSGVSGTFGFSVMTKMLAPFVFMFMDDDDREEWARENPEYVNNMPGYIIEKLIPETFGGYGDLVAYGPVSALTGTNLSARIGYDNLFFKDPVAKTGNIWNDTKSWFLDNFAAGTGRADDFMEGVNYFMEGNWKQGAKRIVPAAIGAPTRAVMAFSEGVTDSRGREVIPKDDISLPMAVRMALGYQPIEVTKTYARLYGTAEQLGAIKAQQGKLLRKLNDAKSKKDYDAIEEVLDEISDFNDLNPGMAITREKIKRSGQSYRSREKGLYRGMDLRKEDDERIKRDIDAFWDPDA
jgi:hypothetical protein